MLHSTWPRLPSATLCCCPKGARWYSRHGSDRTLPNRPNYGAAPRRTTWTNDRRDKQRKLPPHPKAGVQHTHQAERNWRKRMVEGKLSWKERRVLALMKDLDLMPTTEGNIKGTINANSERTTNKDTRIRANTNQEHGGQWSQLKRRQRSADAESNLGNAELFDWSGTATTSTEKWPLLKRRDPSYGYMEPGDKGLDTSKKVVTMPPDDSREVATIHPTDSMELAMKTPDVSTDLVAATREALASKENVTTSKSHTMVRIEGLSTNVLASDFYRIAETDLSRWNQSIKKVQQVRDRMTLDPTGTYHVTFSTAVAATAYAARLQRLHALAQVKARSKTGLWRSEVPPALLPPDAPTPTQEGLEAELAQLSIAPGVQAVTLEHRRVAAGPEGHKIRSLVARDGHGERPPVVLLDVSPAAPAERVRDAVRQHGQRARGSWGLARAHPVAGNLHQQLQRLTTATTTEAEEEVELDEAQRLEDEKQRRATLRKREGLRRVAQHMEGAALRRFVVAFRDVTEAQRFHRLWNGRWLGGYEAPPTAAGAPRHFVRTQVVEY